MNEEIKREVEEINANVEVIRARIGGTWTAFYRGILTGFGYVVGAFLAILIIGWALNVLGIIPAFTEQAENWRNTLQQSANKQTPAK